MAAEGLGWLGEADVAMEALKRTITGGEPYEVLAALNTLEFLWKAGHVPLGRAQRMVEGLDLAEPGNRIPRYLLQIR